MKQFIAQMAGTTGSELSAERICINFAAALILGVVIYISYRFSHSGAVYSARFNVSLLMLTLITTLIMCVIGNNIALSLGMVGALSIIRFRTAIKDPRDASYIFWCIAVGISCGVSYYFLASVGTGLIFLVLLAMGNIKSNDRYLLIIHGTAQTSAAIEESILRKCEGKALLRVKNQGREEVEFIYELSRKMLEQIKSCGTDISETLFGIEGVSHVDIICQNEEMSQ